MISWDDGLKLTVQLANDTNSNTLTFLKKMLNQGYHQLLQAINSEFLEQQSTITTVASTQEYFLPIEASWLDNAVLIDGDNKYDLVEIKSREMWNNVTSTPQTGRPTNYFIDANKGFGMTQIRLYPTPEEVYTIKLTTRVHNKDLSEARYNTGTVGCTAAAVTGAGTTFAAGMVGRYIKFTNGDGFYYKIKTYNSTTSLTLHRSVSATVSAGSAYEIVELFELPEALQMGPVHYALQYFFAWRGNLVASKSNEKMYLEIEKKAKKLYSAKTGNVIISDQSGSVGTYPGHFPTSITP